MGKIIQKLKNNDEEVIVNGGNRIDHVIAKMKAKEKKLTITFACIISFCVFIVGYFIFSSIQDKEEYHNIRTRNLVITYNDGTNAFGDAINLYANDLDSSKKNYNISISNIGNDDVYYTLSIIDDFEMIDADGCSDKIINRNFIRYKINDMATIILDDNVEVIENVLKSGESVNYKLDVWLDGVNSSDGHFHGRIVVKEKKS